MLVQWPAPAEARSGDYLAECQPYGLCWMEGLIGASVRAAGGTIWAEPTGDFDLADGQALLARLADDNPWLVCLRDYLVKLVGAAAGRVPVVQPLMRGPVDMVQSIVGSETLALLANEHKQAS